jgi:16S rRNA (uracil1498-N3)-methyltransferase
MELFFSNEIFETHLFLKIEESGHCIKVLRKTNGDVIKVIDGKGNLYEGPIEIENKNKPVKVHILSKTHFEASKFQSRFHLVIAPTKNADRMEWLVEKAVEMGIASITFVHCEHSERTNLRLDRIEKIAIAALKQSQQYWLPKITIPIPFKNYLEQFPADENCFIAHCADGEKNKFGIKPIKDSCRILIGPEGDFSESEIKLALAAGYKHVSLGASRLRTETAALYACAVYRSMLT